MQVYKFGGASIATPERALSLLPILQTATEPLVIVISALGKTTNALERIVHLAAANNIDEALAATRQVREVHLDYARALLSASGYVQAEKELAPFFYQLQGTITHIDAGALDYWYDQVVCLGELFSTIIISLMLNGQGYNNVWLDARECIVTDNTYRDAVVDWVASANQVTAHIAPLLEKGIPVITQGFIGATPDNKSVTLGREGSDYTAALLAAMLKGTSVTIWKDVEGLLNADPKMFADTVKIPAITYNEVIEMAFYGAQIIHPKTIKPLQNNGIPLYVKCFLDTRLPGTVVCSELPDASYPPLIVRKDNQLLLQVTTRDFSFITENNLSLIYAAFHKLKIRINLIQNAAISFTACMDNQPDKVAALISELGGQYQVRQNEKVRLLTIRHHTPDVFAQHTQGAQILLRQETRRTIQAVMK